MRLEGTEPQDILSCVEGSDGSQQKLSAKADLNRLAFKRAPAAVQRNSREDSTKVT